MGNCAPQTTDSSMLEEAKKQAEIDRKLAEDAARDAAEVKLLLLGAGESGKSTIFKQLKIIHQNGYSLTELKKYENIVKKNVVDNIRTLIRGASKLEINIENENQKLVDYFINSDRSGDWSIEMPMNVQKLWNDKGIQEVYSRRAELQVNDSTKYFFEAIDRIAKPDYTPTEQDVLMSRVRTTGIIQSQFDIDDLHFRIFDVGGQRNERKKWIHCFEDVTAIIFVAAMSEFDQVLVEDGKTNRMHETVKLFGDICNNEFFTKTSIILFLNKRDLFGQKIQKVDLSIAYPEYSGGLDYDNAARFIENTFKSKVKAGAKEDKNEEKSSNAKEFFAHQTCATDTNNVKFVFEAVKKIILENNLKDDKGGFMRGPEDEMMLSNGINTNGQQDKNILSVKIRNKLSLKSSDFISPASKVVKSYVPGSINVVSLQYECSDKTILIDKNANLPFEEVCKGFIDGQSSAFSWLSNLGKELPDLSQMKDGKKEKFPDLFTRACKRLGKRLKTDKLGFMYDKPIVLNGTRSVLLIFIKRVDESKDVIIKRRGFSWMPTIEVEKELYSKYHNISRSIDLNQLNATFTGERFIESCRRYSDGLYEGIEEGTYVASMLIKSTTTGFEILVPESHRNLLPMNKITSNYNISDTDWQWIQGIRLREAGGASTQTAILGNERYRTFLSEKDSFKQHFYHALEALKSHLSANYTDIGSLYDSEMISMNELDTVKLILYVTVVHSNSDERLKGLLEEEGFYTRYCWIPVSQFETNNYNFFHEKCRAKIYGRAVEILRGMADIPQEDLDEKAKAGIKKLQEKSVRQLNSIEKKWDPFRWVNRTVEWGARDSLSVKGRLDKDGGIDGNTDGMENDAIIQLFNKTFKQKHIQSRSKLIRGILS